MSDYLWPPVGLAPLFFVSREHSCPEGGYHEWVGPSHVAAEDRILVNFVRCSKCPALRSEVISLD